MILLYITAPSLVESKKIASALLGKKLIACANIVQSHSIYNWKGKKVSGKEFIVFAKTANAKADSAEKLVKKIHSYEVPNISRIKISSNKEYEKWVFGELR